MASGLMEVHLLNAKGLKDTDFLGKIDPFVVVQYKNQERNSKVARGKGSNPVWNERLTFKVEYPAADGQYKVILKVMDKDTFSKNDFIGQAVIYVKDVVELGMVNGKAELPPTKYRVVLADKTYRGEIQVGITFTRKNEEKTDTEEYGGWKESHF